MLSKIIRIASCTILSVKFGIPKGLSLIDPGLGMYILRYGLNLNLFSLSCKAMFSILGDSQIHFI
jgi:hypothetical protein